jgi:hypothetical protein
MHRAHTDPRTQSSKDDKKRQKADLAAEERSEDDGMAEHKEKSSDPSRWSDEAPARAKTSAPRLMPLSRTREGASAPKPFAIPSVTRGPNNTGAADSTDAHVPRIDRRQTDVAVDQDHFPNQQHPAAPHS